MKRRIILLITMTLLMVNVAYASDLTWGNAPGHHNQSVLLAQMIVLPKIHFIS